MYRLRVIDGPDTVMERYVLATFLSHRPKPEITVPRQLSQEAFLSRPTSAKY